AVGQGANPIKRARGDHATCLDRNVAVPVGQGFNAILGATRPPGRGHRDVVVVGGVEVLGQYADHTHAASTHGVRGRHDDVASPASADLGQNAVTGVAHNDP